MAMEQAEPGGVSCTNRIAVAHRLVEVDMEAHLVGIEVARPVHVSDRHRDELQFHAHP